MTDSKKTNKERVADLFIKNVGYVISSHRKQKGYKMDVLAREMGVDTSTLSRYENGKIDIPASAMAYASYLCDFELSEYTFSRYEGKKLSQLFKEIVKLGEEERTKVFYSRTRRPRYDRTDEQGNIIPTYPVVTIEVEKPPIPAPTQEDDDRFDRYMSTDASTQKRHLLMYAMKFAELTNNSKDAKTAIRAMTRCIASDKDR